MIVGSVLVYPGTLGQTFITQNCELAYTGQLDEVSPFFRSLFREIQIFDHKIHKAINPNMCSEKCRCQNDNNQTLKKLYDSYDESIFNSYERTKKNEPFMKDGVI